MKRVGPCIIALLQCCAAWSMNAERTLSQLNRRAFTPADGVPSDIRALAQTSDGTLWIGGRDGLTRFDGIRFVTYPEPSDPPLPTTNISSLLAAPDGGLWIGFNLGGAGFLKGGRLAVYTPREGIPDGTVEQLAWDRDGSLWAAARTGLGHFKDGRWERVTEERQLGAPYGVLVDRAGTLWVAAADGLFTRLAGADGRFRKVETSVAFASGGVGLAASPDGSIWSITSSHEMIRIDPPTSSRTRPIVTLSGIRGPLLFDDEGNLWAVNANPNTFFRFPSAALAGEGPPDRPSNAETFSQAEGLSSGRVTAIIEDREKNVWVAMNSGLYRFSHSNFVGKVAPSCPQYVFQAAVLVAGDAGSLWIACDNGTTPELQEIRDGAVISRQITPAFSAGFRDSQGTVWFGGPTGIGHLEAGRVVTTPLPPQVLGRPVQALARDRSGAIWASFVRRSVYRMFEGEWSEYGGLDALPRGFAIVETADADGAVWFGYRDNQVARVNGRSVQLFDTTKGLQVGNVLAILAEDGEVWVGGELGLARFDGRRFVMLSSASGSPFRGLSGIARALNGDLWLNGIAGIVHIGHDEIESLRINPAHRLACETFNYLDGVVGTAVQVRPLPSAVTTTDGNVWFSTTAGLVSIDANHLRHNTLPPPVTIWAVASGHTRYPVVDGNLQLPVHTTGLQIEYSAGSLTVPERVRFRYKLEGTDLDWQDVGARREATYTNLRPGHYIFRVIASNNDGLWNKTGASTEFTILPAFYETRWFNALCALAGTAFLAAVLWMLYQLRLRQVTRQFELGLEARVAERTRIARELHDTLLQSFQGLLLRFHTAARLLPTRPAEAKDVLDSTMDQAEQALAEGRNAVQGLRPSAIESYDLADAIKSVGEELAADATRERFIPLTLRVEGEPRKLQAIVRDEIYRIAGEALRNAYRHSGATRIEIDLQYDERQFELRVRDDGKGIDSKFLTEEARGKHFGLRGMRERAATIGGKLTLWTSPDSGTEIDLTVPKSRAYRVLVRRRSRLLKRLFAVAGGRDP